MNEKIIELFREKKYSEIKEWFSHENEADVAALFSDLFEDELEKREVLLLYRLLPKDMAAEVFAHFEPEIQQYLIEAFSDKELRDMLSDTFVDDAVDMLEEMPANIVSRVLRNADPETRKAINEILKYPRDSAGSIMTIEYVSLAKHMTVEDAFTRIRRTGLDKETIYTCYVVDGARHLVGLVTVKDLLLADTSDVIENIMETHVLHVHTHEDREVVSGMIRKYDFLAMPVVDNENRLVGIVTVDDVLDVIQEENTEDIEKMAAIVPTDKPYMRTSVFETWKKRIPWLLMLMISATFTGSILTHYEDALAAWVVLTAYIPMLMDTGGNAGGQASVTIIRGLALGEIKFVDTLKVIGKELRVALMCGATLAAANFVKLMLFDRAFNPSVTISVAAVICLTLIITVVLAKLVGCTLPIAAKRIGFDPAVMASPFITTVVDALSLVVYFKIAVFLLHIA